MNTVDLLFVLLLAVVMPVHGALSFRRYVRLARLGSRVPRTRLYLQTQAMEWSLFAALAAMWLLQDRPVSALGFVAPGGTGFWISLGIAVLACGYMIYTWQEARRMNGEERATQYEQLGDLQLFLPHTRRDYRHFVALSLTAGWVEEIVYRGFLFWLFAQVMPMWGVVLASSVVFGLGHSYQGAGGMLRVFAIGIVFGVLYAASGSIWVPIALHMLVDIIQGAMLLEFAKRPPAGPGEAATPGPA